MLFGFGKKRDTQRAAESAQAELSAAFEAADSVFGANMSTLLTDVDALKSGILAGYDYRGVTDMFLRGVIDAFIQGRPPFPTPARDRVQLHMAAYLAEREKIGFEAALERTKETDRRFDEADPAYDAVMAAGADAYRNGGNEKLASANRAFLAQLQALNEPRPVTYAEMMDASAGGMRDPPVDPTMRSNFDTLLVGAENDTPMRVWWCREWAATVADISNKPTRYDQRCRVMWHLAKEEGWLALCEAVTPAMSVDSWRGFVQGVDNFDGRPDSQFFGALAHRHMLAVPTSAMLRGIGRAFFDYSEFAAESIEAFKRHRSYYVRTVVALRNSVNRWPSDDDEGAEAQQRKVEGMASIVDEMRDLSTRLMEEAVTGRMDVRQAQADISDLHQRCIGLLRTLGLALIP